MKALYPILAAGLDAPKDLGGPATFAELVGRVTNALLVIAGAVAVIMIVVGGIRYILSAGNEKGTQAAKSTITNAVVGLIITLLAFAIVNFVLSVFS